MFSLLFAAIFKVALPFIFFVALVDALTMTRTKRARVMRRSGSTYKTIASRLKVSPTTARRYALA
jgi:ABC-type dipeptide/oligopeptide/nickel transport system permease subunit